MTSEEADKICSPRLAIETAISALRVDTAHTAVLRDKAMRRLDIMYEELLFLRALRDQFAG
jgi:hypothetical protein